MLFHSLEFVAFFVVVYSLYLCLPHRGQNVLLLLASYLFYGLWDWRFLLLLWFSTTVDYLVSKRIEASSDRGRQKAWLTVGISVNLGVLGFFKYFNFFVGNLERFLWAAGFESSLPVLKVILPLGISFYTFQAISYITDVYRGEIRAAKHWQDYALYVAFFTQLIAGPLERAKHFLPQILKSRIVTLEGFYEGAWLFFWGVYKKIVIADNLARMADPIFENYRSASGAESLLAVYAFAFQILADFSGYTDMARGLARTMGFELVINFRTPYFVTNPSEFWKHWHISLSSWLKDYLYIPLGGSRKGSLFTFRNLMITMLLGGLWHGARWNFVVWGAYHGLLLFAYHAIQKLRKQPESTAPSAIFLKMLFMFHLTCIGWLIFRSAGVTPFLETSRSILSLGGFTAVSGVDFLKLSVLIFPLMMAQIWEYRGAPTVSLLKQGPVFKIAVYVFLFLSFIVWGGQDAKEFIYFQF